MTFASRLSRCPRAFDPGRGREVLAGLPSLPGELGELVRGATGCSPYLAELAQREGTWLVTAFDDPETAVAQTSLIDWRDDELGRTLRQAKRRMALLTALADLGGVWSLEMVTGVLTEFADRAVDAALRHALRPQVVRGKLPGLTDEMLDEICGVTVLAMGKMGAGELNYSSDIDLICLFDETRFAPDEYADLRSGFSKAVRQMCTTLSDTRAGGYVFRTDLRLRPDPSVTPVALSMAAAERYYESLGRTWERAAYIKARPCAGDIGSGERFLSDLTPFVWRKHLDFAAIEDAHNMRLAIREHKGLSGPITLPGHDMKLGRGGIREIEFFTQTRQLIAGGRDASLRARGTVAGLDALARAGWVPRDQSKALIDHYRAHREVEHRLQMVQDAQTHSLPRSDEGFARLAAMLDRDAATLKDELFERLSYVHHETEGFFAPQKSEATAAPDAAAIDPQVMERWRGYPAMRSERAQMHFERILPNLVHGLEAAGRPSEALVAFDGFLAGLPAGVQLFSLFEANPQLVDLLIDVLTAAPPLADHLARNAGVLDAVIGGDFFADWPGLETLAADLSGQLCALDDYERKLDAARLWAKEWHFRAGVHYLRGLTTAAEAGTQYADLAQATLRALWPHVVAQFAERHGPMPGRGAVVLGMGSVGSHRMTPVSDLDVIVIYDADGADQSEGVRPLASQPYYARLTKALITALSAQTAEGRLYEVDMRLRPSGNQGPVATSWRGFQSYQREEAWLWEHLALTRASVLAGPADLAEDVEACLREVLALPRERAMVTRAVSDMRERIAAAKSPTGPLDAKSGPGRLLDIELFIQAGALIKGTVARDVADAAKHLPDVGLASAEDARTLAHTYATAWSLQVATRLVAGEARPDVELGQGAQAMILRALQAGTLNEAGAELEAMFLGAARIIDAGLSEGDSDGEQG